MQIVGAIKNLSIAMNVNGSENDSTQDHAAEAS